MKDSIQEAYFQIITQEEQLEEGAIRNTLAAAGLAVSVAAGINALKQDAPQTSNEMSGKITKAAASKDFNLPRDHLLKTVTSKFNTSI